MKYCIQVIFIMMSGFTLAEQLPREQVVKASNTPALIAPHAIDATLGQCMASCNRARCGFMRGGGCAHNCGVRYVETASELAQAYQNKIDRYEDLYQQGGCLEKEIANMTVSIVRASTFKGKKQAMACKDVVEYESCINDFSAYRQNNEKCKTYITDFGYDTCASDFEYLWLKHKQEVYEKTNTIVNAKEWPGYCMKQKGRVIGRCREGH